MMPHCTATFSVWLCGLPITWPVAKLLSPVAACSNNPRVEPVPWPMTGASAKNRRDFRQNSSRNPIDVAAFSVL